MELLLLKSGLCQKRVTFVYMEWVSTSENKHCVLLFSPEQNLGHCSAPQDVVRMGQRWKSKWLFLRPAHQVKAWIDRKGIRRSRKHVHFSEPTQSLHIGVGRITGRRQRWVLITMLKCPGASHWYGWGSGVTFSLLLHQDGGMRSQRMTFLIGLQKRPKAN